MSFSERDVRRELARIFQSDVKTYRESGLTDTKETYNQVRLIISTSLLFYPNSIFRIARLAANRLTTLVIREASIIEDILASLEFVGRSKEIPTDTTKLSNSYTALLALDASDSVKNRPELEVFSRNIERFASDVSGPVVQDGEVIMSGEEAKLAVRAAFDELKTVHPRVVQISANLRDLGSVYDQLDIPSLVSSTAFSNIRNQITTMQAALETGNQAELEAKSKAMLLKSLVAKSAVSLVSNTAPPSRVLYRGPYNPFPSGRKYHGRPAGSGTPAYASSSKSGPWVLPMSGDLELSIDGGPPAVIDLSALYGAVLTTRNKALFDQGADDDKLFITVDPDIYSGQISGGGTITVGLVFPSSVSLGFKHLGAPIVFPGIWSAGAGATDHQYRYITDFGLFATAATGSFDPVTKILTAATWGPGRSNFLPSDAGKYAEDSVAKYEITEYIDASNIRVRAPSINWSSGVEVRGIEGTSGNIGFLPAVSANLSPAWNLEWAYIGPASKAAQLIGSAQTATQVASDLNDNNGSTVGDNKLGLYCEAYVSPTDPDKVAIRALSPDPYLMVTSNHLAPIVAPGGGQDLYDQSAHQVLGLFVGETESGDLLFPAELAEYINLNVTGAAASAVEEDRGSGTARQVYSASSIEDTSADFVALGVEEGWQVEIVGSDQTGIYRVESATATQLVLRGITFPSAGEVSYRLFTQTLKIESDSDTLGSSVEIVSAPAEMGFPSEVQYGTTPYFEAVDNRGTVQLFSNVSVGDLLSTRHGTSEILANIGGMLELATPLPTEDEDIQFEVLSYAADSYDNLSTDMAVWTTSKGLLKKYGFDESLGQLDAALSPVFSGGRGFLSVRKKARRMLADLLSILTDSPLRADEYREEVPTASLNLKSILEALTAPDEPSVDGALSSLDERGYDKAAAMILDADLSGFFRANEETSTYGGSITSSVRTALQDLPAVSSEYREVQEDLQFELESLEIDDPEVVVEEDEDWFEEGDL